MILYALLPNKDLTYRKIYNFSKRERFRIQTTL